jgi:hypothetical protein
MDLIVSLRFEGKRREFKDSLNAAGRVGESQCYNDGRRRVTKVDGLNPVFTFAANPALGCG